MPCLISQAIFNTLQQNVVVLCVSSTTTLTGPRGALRLQNKFSDDLASAFSLATTVALAMALCTMIRCDAVVFNGLNTNEATCRGCVCLLE